VDLDIPCHHSFATFMKHGEPGVQLPLQALQMCQQEIFSVRRLRSTVTAMMLFF
jgi:hypothetical protein